MSSSRTSPPGAGVGARLVDVTMPQMGVSVAEGTIVAWRVEVGDRVAADQTVCDISTDKIDSEVPAPAAGVVTEILVGVEQTVDVGTVLARLALAGGDQVDGGDAVDGGLAVAPAPEAPIAPAAAATANGASAAPEGESPAGDRYYSPVVRRVAAAHGIDLSRVVGTGRGGRVRKQDVMALVEDGGNGGVSAGEEPPLHIESPYRPELAVASPRPDGLSAQAIAPDSGQLSRMRRTIGEHMKRSLDTAATCTTWIEVDMSGVETARARLGVTALAFVARACIASLRDQPALNACLQDGRYTRFDDAVHLGIAVSLGQDGLIVPVIRDAHTLSEEGLAVQIRSLAKRARAGELTPDEVRGGTFTITNPGQYGSIMATPVINLPQVAILDLEAIVKRPVVVTDPHGNDSIAIRSMTILGMSWDHRALDGVLAAQFLAAVKQRLEAVAAQ